MKSPILEVSLTKFCNNPADNKPEVLLLSACVSFFNFLIDDLSMKCFTQSKSEYPPAKSNCSSAVEADSSLTIFNATQYMMLFCQSFSCNRHGKSVNSGCIFMTNLNLSLKHCIDAAMKRLERGTPKEYIMNSFIKSSPILMDFMVSLYLISWQLSHTSSSIVYLQAKFQ